VTIELTHNWGTETKEGPAYHSGNQEKDGFGHLAFACEDVYKCSEDLEAAGVLFKKRPDEGRMKVMRTLTCRHKSVTLSRRRIHCSVKKSVTLSRRGMHRRFVALQKCHTQ
jgi:catechol 2,3-dioxygenase-like lactoylglutathione lyase family enzyme